MEDKLIVTVCAHRCLYATTDTDYKHRGKKELAWRKVSEETGLPDDYCRKKWKTLRDTYLKERKKETERRSGAAAGSGKRWKYMAVLSFLDPFITARPTTSNWSQGVEDSQDPMYGGEETATGQREEEQEENQGDFPLSPFSPLPSSESEGPSTSAADGPSTSAADGPSTSAADGPSTSAAVSRVINRTRPHRRSRSEVSEVERQLLEILKRPPQFVVPPPPPPLTEDEYFFKSLLPAMERMPREQKEFVKFQIHKLIYESSTVSLNVVPLEPSD